MLTVISIGPKEMLENLLWLPIKKLVAVVLVSLMKTLTLLLTPSKLLLAVS